MDAHLWKKAMETELEFMYSNQVWELVEAPKGIQSIGCKWVYKRRVQGKVKTFEARLTAKGYIVKNQGLTKRRSC